MSAVAVSMREAARLLRASPARTAVVASTVAMAAAFGAAVEGLAVGCVAVSFAVVAVARRSPRPERLASALAWNRVGATRASVWAAGAVEALAVGWVAVVVGTSAGLLGQRAAGGSGGAWSAFLAAQLVAVAVAAGLPTATPVVGTRRSRLSWVIQGGGTAARVLACAAALVSARSLVIDVRTDLEVAVAGALTIALLAFVGLLAAEPATRLVISAVARLPRCGSLDPLARRHRVPGAARLVIVAAVGVATATSILGASIEARPETWQLLDAKLAELPVLPSGVALVSLEPDGRPTIGGLEPDAQQRAELAPGLRSELAASVPGAAVIELRHLGAQRSLLCVSDCEPGPFVVAEPRLRSIYGNDARYPAPPGIVGIDQLLYAGAETRVRPRAVLARRMWQERPLAPASFAGAVFYEVNSEAAASLDVRPRVRSLFIRSRDPLTAADLRRIDEIALVRRPARRLLVDPGRSRGTDRVRAAGVLARSRRRLAARRSLGGDIGRVTLVRSRLRSPAGCRGPALHGAHRHDRPSARRVEARAARRHGLSGAGRSRLARCGPRRRRHVVRRRVGYIPGACGGEGVQRGEAGDTGPVHRALAGARRVGGRAARTGRRPRLDSGEAGPCGARARGAVCRAAPGAADRRLRRPPARGSLRLKRLALPHG